MTHLTLNTDVLRFARERSGLDTVTLARRLTVKPERIEEWEGDGAITYRQAADLAKVARIPLALIFGDRIPDLDDNLSLPDYRTHLSNRLVEPSPELLDVVRDARYRQEWYRDHALIDGFDPVALVDSVKLVMSPVDAAKVIRQKLPEFPHLKGNVEKRLTKDVEYLEDSGILILRSGIVGHNTHRPLDSSEFRGFAIADELAPLIFINTRDTKTAQRFTLVHELVHIALGLSGISNPSLAPRAQHSKVESFCNATAAELLVPTQDARSLQMPRSPEEWYSVAATRFGVSPYVLLLRLRDLGTISRQKASTLYTSLITYGESLREGQVKKEGSGNGVRNIIARNGKLLTRTVVEQAFEGNLLFRDAIRLLGAGTVDTLREAGKMLGMINIG